MAGETRVAGQTGSLLGMMTYEITGTHIYTHIFRMLSSLLYSEIFPTPFNHRGIPRSNSSFSVTADSKIVDVIALSFARRYPLSWTSRILRGLCR